MLLMGHKVFSFVKMVFLVFALFLASFLLFTTSKVPTPDQKIVFVLDVNKTMNTQDILSGAHHFSRLQAAKCLIQQQIISDPQFSYGLIIFNAGADYIIPPTFDSWSFFLYLSGITSNLLSDWVKKFAGLSWFLQKDGYTSYLLISDFDTQDVSSNILLPRWIRLLGLWSSLGDKVRYSNGVVYYDNGKSVFSARNDKFAQSLNRTYTILSHIDHASFHGLLFHDFNIPVSQRIFLYVILWILVILVVFL